MPDISLLYTPGQAGELGYFDLYIANGDLAIGNDLQTAVYMSLFTDRLANPDDVLPDGSNDRRGWWGDSYAPTDTNGQPLLLGSRLWLLARAKKTDETLTLAQEYCQEALQWLLDFEISNQVIVTTSWAGNPSSVNILTISIQIYQPGFQSTASPVTLQYSYVWDF